MNKFLIELFDVATDNFGLSLILYTLLVKAFLFPLYYGQMRSAARMQAVQPKLLEIRRRWAGNQEKINMETSRLYIEEEINPLAGLLPSFAQIPIFLALYRSITQLSETDPHFRESFLWIPSLIGPTFERGYGLGWLTAFGGPEDLDLTAKAIYTILPVLLVLSQVVNQKVNMPEQEEENWLTKTISYLPFLSGLTAMSSPAGIGVYWFTNSVLSFGQSILVKDMLKNQGLDMKELRERNMAALKDPEANAAELKQKENEAEKRAK